MSLLNLSNKIFSRLRRKLYLSVQAGDCSRLLCLRPLSGLWAAISFVKNRLYDLRLLPVHRAPVFVISVGNLVAGGSGKTPLVHLLAQSLSSAGPIAIISRGYLAKESGLKLGDELTMLSRRLPDAICMVNPDRAAAAFDAAARGARVIILDDAFQHRRLHRDLNLVVVDAANPFGYNAFLPRGLLRDSPSRLRQADAIFINGDPTDRLLSDLRKWSDAPLITVQLCLERILNLHGGEQKSLAGSKIGAFCAIGQPQRFFQTLEKANAQIVERCIFPDHEKIEDSQIQSFARRCRHMGATALVCTEKDAVKIPFDCPLLPVYYLEMQLKVVFGEENWQNLIKKIDSTRRDP